MPILTLLLFVSIFILIMYGYPVAFTMGGLSLLYAVCFVDPSVLEALPMRIYGTMNNYVLLAVPLFIYMGLVLEKSGIAQQMIESMSMLFGKRRGGLAYSVILVGALLAASTGVVGATVVTMGLISLPVMLERGYKPEIATGVIASAGTLGQIIPPSVILVLLGSVMNVPVGDLFKSAFWPGVSLAFAYALLIWIVSIIRPSWVPGIDSEQWEILVQKNRGGRSLQTLLLPLLLILAVLGSIFWGIATPTEAAAIGALAAILLSVFNGSFSWSMIKEVNQETTRLSSMVFFILLGAAAFSIVFRELGGDHYLVSWIEQSGLEEWQFLMLVMFMIFVAGFFIDFIEIIFIFVPVVLPVFKLYGTNLEWLAILFALNLQTSFLTPPFGFALFYLKGVAPPTVKTADLYRGIVPFVLLQLLFLAAYAVLFKP